MDLSRSGIGEIPNTIKHCKVCLALNYPPKFIAWGKLTFHERVILDLWRNGIGAIPRAIKQCRVPLVPNWPHKVDRMMQVGF